MTSLNTAEFKALLLAQRESVQAQLTALRGGNVTRAEASAAHFSHSEESPAQTNTERDLEFALDAHDSAELRSIAAALQRIDNGVYGECTDCGVHIPEARLKVAPDAPRCIHCQEKAEKAGDA